MQVALYDLKTMKFENAQGLSASLGAALKIRRYRASSMSSWLPQVLNGSCPEAAVDFLPKRCLLVVADQAEHCKGLETSVPQGGHISFWRMRPHPDQWTCIFHFRRS